ncbi:MAG TPA: cysteine desulfurase family protein [Vicinamibacterales bacterium]
MKLPIYLDCHATTPVDRRVFDAMAPYFTEVFGNAASTGHAYGRAALEAVTHARATIARCLNVDPEEIVFTSGATESDNLAIKGVAGLRRQGHIVTAATEHKAVLDACRSLAAQGFRVTVLPVDREGFVDPDDVRRALTPDTILVSIMHGNNEVGTVQDIAAIAAICREREIPFHTDATQTIGKLPFDAQALGVDMASLTAHKMYGPKGIGALYVRRSCRLCPMLDGGGHEQGLRSGTLNVPGIVGLATALEIAVADMPRDIEHTRSLRDRLWDALREVSPTVRINGPDPRTAPERRLPNNLHVSIEGLEAYQVSEALADVAVSTRSACTSGSAEPSHVLKALGGCVEGCTTLRFGVGRCTTAEEINYVVDRLHATVKV